MNCRSGMYNFEAENQSLLRAVQALKFVFRSAYILLFPGPTRFATACVRRLRLAVRVAAPAAHLATLQDPAAMRGNRGDGRELAFGRRGLTVPVVPPAPRLATGQDPAAVRPRSRGCGDDLAECRRRQEGDACRNPGRRSAPKVGVALAKGLRCPGRRSAPPWPKVGT